MTYDQWVHTFFPLNGETGNISQTGDYHECEVSIALAHSVAQVTNGRAVWTMVEGDDGESWYIVPGFHIVNRIGHVLTHEPWRAEHESLCIPYIEASDNGDVPFDGTGTGGDGDA